MKRLYTRLVLWLIRPAVDAAIAESVKPGGQLWRLENRGGTALPDRAIVGDVRRTPDSRLSARIESLTTVAAGRQGSAGDRR